MKGHEGPYVKGTYLLSSLSKTLSECVKLIYRDTNLWQLVYNSTQALQIELRREKSLEVSHDGLQANVMQNWASSLAWFRTY